MPAESVLQIPSHIQPPCGIELKVSLVDTSRIGTFTVNDIKKDTEFGPYLGRIVYDKDDESIDSKYSWEVFDLNTFKYLHTIDATNEADGNWMRYICCARYFEEQNIVSMQNGTDVYYKALKDIASGEELLTWFQPKKKKKRRSSCRKSLDVFSAEEESPSLNSRQVENQDSAPKSPGKMKRQRKPKIIPDSYSGPFDFYQKRFRATKQSDVNILEPLQPGQKRRRKRFSDALDSSCLSKTGSPKSESDFGLISKNPGVLLRTNSDTSDLPMSTISSKKSRSVSWPSSENVALKKAIEDDDSKLENVIDGKKGTGGISQSIAEINSHVEWNYPPKGNEFLFELKNHHVIRKDNKKLYKCDICMGLYKHMFSLKRHYLRNHINYKYVSKADITNCLINLSVVVQNMKDKLPEGLDLDNSENMDDTKHADENGIGNNKICNGRDLIADNALEDDQTKVTAKAPDSQLVDTEKEANDTEEEVIDTKKEVIEIEKDEIPKNCVSTDFKAKQTEMKKSHGEAKIFDEADILNDNNTCSKNDSDERPTTDSILKESNKELNMSFDSLCSPKCKESIVDRTNITQANRTEEKSKVKENIAGGSARPGLFKCYTCYRVFNHIQDIRSHVQNHPEQAEGTVFSCTQCSMRFNYKQNLVRHKRSHESGGPSIQKHASPIKESKLTKRPMLKPKVGELEHSELSAEKPPSIDDRTYRCGKCAKLFTFLQAMKEHVQKEHTSGSKYQCQYCGKDFLSMPNMKKHVRFHLGYRASCKECTDTFSNVGALRKHTRLAHPEIYKAKLLERLEKFGFLRGPDKKKKSVEKLKKVRIEKVKELVKKAKEITVLTEETVKKKDKDLISYSEFGFTADEIDDGGSRFKFSCTVCKKRFSSYINMCRHRRRTHGSESRHRVEQCLTFSKRSNPPVLESPAVIAEFYAGVSQNIATNLNCFIDGKPEHLEKFVDHIKIEDYKGNFGYNTEQEEPLGLIWEKYNFPLGFKPAKTISFAEIKNVLDIHNDFDSHCCPLDTETKNCEEQDISTEQTEQSEGDLKDKQSEKITPVDIGNKTQGFRILSSLGSVFGLKEPSGTNCKKQESKYINVKITNGQITSEYPAAKTVIQVSNGDFSNFPESVLCDLDTPVEKSLQLSTKCEMARNMCYGHMQDGKAHIEDVSLEVLNKRAQDEINTLYDNIEEQLEGTKPSSCIQSSPRPLSALCERFLGLHAYKSKTVCDISKAKGGIEVLEKLCLSSNCDKEKKNSIEDIHSNGPDYSNVPEDSPFYNYDTIAFGKHGHIERICAVCTKHFKDIDSLFRHHWKKHPASVCNFLEVEHGNEIEKLHFTQPSYVGAIAVTDPRLESIDEMDSFRCTRCEIVFNTVTKLHMHILNCCPLNPSCVDPICKWSKIDKSASRTPLKKKLQRKLNHMHGVQGTKSNLDFGSLKPDGHKSATLLQKRVFTGCRKRTSIILPDSPVKTIVDPELQLSVMSGMSGYNPNNHVRRRELKEVMDTLTCKACGLKFKTIILLERHVKHCSKKEKFKDVQPMSCPIMDESLATLKNVCCYCDKNFTYTKSLANHLLDFCPVKRAKMDQGKVTDVDKQNEAFMIDKIQKLEEKKSIKDKDNEDRPKKTMTWQMGRKSKRKGHAWTNIKKRYLKNIDTDKNEATVSNETDGIENNVLDTNCADENSLLSNDKMKLENSDFLNGDITNNYFEKFEIVNNEKIVENMETVSKESCVYMDKEVGVEETLLRDLSNNSLTSTAQYTVYQELLSSVRHKPDESEKASKSTINASKQVTKLLECAKLPACLPEHGVVLGKRKHERVGKVDEFLKNAFRKRRSNKEAVNYETSDVHSKGTSHNALQISGETTISCENNSESETFTTAFEALHNKQSGVKVESYSLASTEIKADTGDNQLTKVHRGRGRPKLGHNLQDINNKTKDVSRPRGRPRIHEFKTLSFTSKRKPGRPPKIQATVPVTHVKDQSIDLFATIDSKHVSGYEHLIDESDQKKVDDNEIANCNSDDVMNGNIKKCVDNDEVDGDSLQNALKNTESKDIKISMIQKNTLNMTKESILISCKESTNSNDCITFSITLDEKGAKIQSVRKVGACNPFNTNAMETDKCEVINKLENSNTNDLNGNFLHFEVVSSEVNKISNETDSVKADKNMAEDTSCLQKDTNMAQEPSCLQTDANMAEKTSCLQTDMNRDVETSCLQTDTNMDGETYCLQTDTNMDGETSCLQTDTNMDVETSCWQTDTNMDVETSCLQNAFEYVCLHNESSNSENQETEALQNTFSNFNEDSEEKVADKSENENITKKSKTNASKSNTCTNIDTTKIFEIEMSRILPPANYKDTCSEGNYLDMNKSHSPNLEYSKESINWNLHGNNTGINNKNSAKESINDEMLVSCANKVTEDICDKKMNFKEGQFDLVLSPSERVKMNKRRCKKNVELLSPIWVKGTVQFSVKTENKNINTFKEIKKTESVSDRTNATNEQHTRKRPMFKKGNNQCSKLQISSANIISQKKSITTSSKCKLNSSTFPRGKKRKIYESNESDI